MNKRSLEDFKSLAESLEEIIKCPVCYCSLRTTTVTCVNGHVICEICKQGQTRCPTCREDFSNVKRAGVLEKILEVLPHTCRYKDCGELVKSGDDHELYCRLKPTTCKYCDWTGPAKDILTHMEDKHPNKTIFTEKHGLCLGNFNPNEEVHTFELFSAFGHAIWWEEFTDITSRVVRHTLHLIPNGKPAHDLFFSLEFKSATAEHFTAIKLKTGSNINSSEENCFCIPTSILHNFIGDDKALNYNVVISKTRR